MPPHLVFQFGAKRIKAAGSGTDAMRSIKNLEAVAMEAEEKMGLHPGTYDFYDIYGLVKTLEDLQRAVKMAGEDQECVLELREHRQFTQIKELQHDMGVTNARIARLEAALSSLEAKFDMKLEAVAKELKIMIKKVDKKVDEEVMPVIDGLCKDRTRMDAHARSMQAKLDLIDLEELRIMCETARNLQEEVKACVRRVEHVDAEFHKSKKQLENDVSRAQQDLKDLQRFMQGKLDVLMEADAEMRREMQLTSERLAYTQDELRLLTEDITRITTQTDTAMNESEELRDLLGRVRKENLEIGQGVTSMTTRLNCLEGTAQEKWEGFAPGVLYFRTFHKAAKGCDVKLSADLQFATARGSLAVAGVVIGSDEGLCMADGPCRRFGTPGNYSSYYEFEIDEICGAPANAGGVFCGFSIQNGTEVANHPKHEFDGYLMGGNAKALSCRASAVETAADAIPATFMAGAESGEDHQKRKRVKQAMSSLLMLRKALPPMKVGHTRELGSTWNSQLCNMGDRIGVLFKCERSGGAKLRISVNGEIKGEHSFLDAPPAEAIGFLCPIMRLCGSCKSIKLFDDLAPPSEILEGW